MLGFSNGLENPVLPVPRHTSELGMLLAQASFSGLRRAGMGSAQHLMDSGEVVQQTGTVEPTNVPRLTDPRHRISAGVCQS